MNDDSLRMRDDEDEYLYQQRIAPIVEERAAAIRINRMAKELAEGTDDQPLQFLTLDDIRRRPTITWLADRFIAQGTVAALSGPSGAGKSFVAVDLACSIATGRPFLGDRPTKQGRVLYIAGEGIAGLGQRVAAWEAARGVQVPADALHFLDAGVNLSNAKNVARLVEGNKEHGYSLIIVDTFSTLGGVEDENKAPEVARVIASLVQVRQAHPNGSALVLHHTGKDADRGSRGSSAFQANVDTSWILRGESAAFSLSSKGQHGGKMKDAPTEEIHGLTLDTQGSSAVVLAGATAPVGEARERVLNVIRVSFADRDFTTGEITDPTVLGDMGISVRTAKTALKNLADTGVVVQVKHGTYRLTESATT